MNTTAILKVPDTPLALEAWRIVAAALPQAVLNHSLRSYLLAKAYAAKRQLTYDEEGFYIAALFHDVGLCDKDSDLRLPFQMKSSLKMKTFLEEKGIPRDRISPLIDAIDFHFQFFPRWSLGNEAGLLQVGTWMDLTMRKRVRVWREANCIASHFRRRGIDFVFPFLLVKSMTSIPACIGILFPRKCGSPS